MDTGDQLASIQAEIQEVKKALRDGRAHFGMKSEELSQYLRDLNAKENMTLSLHLRNMSIDGNAHGAMMPVGALAQAGQGPPARAPPPGSAKAFDKESLPSILTHLCVYEGVPVECVKAVRALATLAYSNAALVGGDAQALPQVLRVLYLHPSEKQVQVHAARAICNMAYDPAVALGRLSTQEVLGALVEAMSQPSHDDGCSADVRTKASEALARVIAVETSPDEDAAAARKAAPDGPGPLASLFAAASHGPEPWKGNTVKLVQQLVDNEVVGAPILAKCFVKASTLVHGAPASSGWGWLRLGRQLAQSDVPNMGQALIDEGAIVVATGIMQTCVTDGRVTLEGIETLSVLVGNLWSGLQSFVDAQGMMRIEAGMRSHRDDPAIQTKGLRALRSGMNWPEDMRKRAGYSTERYIELTKMAMSVHVDCVELQIAALEALCKYTSVMKGKDEVKRSGGETLIKATMAYHLNDKDVQRWGRQVLDSLGVDSSWQPR